MKLYNLSKKMSFFDGQKHNKYMTFAINSAKKKVPLQIYTKMYTIVNIAFWGLSKTRQNAMQA